jgi:hypothetical protein
MTTIHSTVKGVETGDWKTLPSDGGKKNLIFAFLSH